MRLTEFVEELLAIVRAAEVDAKKADEDVDARGRDVKETPNYNHVMGGVHVARKVHRVIQQYADDFSVV